MLAALRSPGAPRLALLAGARLVLTCGRCRLLSAAIDATAVPRSSTLDVPVSSRQSGRPGAVMRFEWDADKAKRNAVKHGVTFDEASTAFGDPLSFTIDDPDHSQGEVHLLLLGETRTRKLVVVAHVVRAGTVRIVSARLAERHERRTYEEG